MRVGIGAILGVRGGPASYARGLISGLIGLPAAHEFVLITDSPEALPKLGAHFRVVRLPLARAWQQAFWDQFVPYVGRREALDLYHGTKGVLPLWGTTRCVVTIHDLAVYRHPETFSVLQRLHQRSLVPLSVRRAERIIADSEHARTDISTEFRSAAERVRVIPLAAGVHFSPSPTDRDAAIATALSLPQRFVLYAGTVQPRKHVDVLVRAFSEDVRPDGVELLIAGRLRPGYRADFLERPPPGVRYLGAVDDEQLAVLYRRALAFCSPSSYEGFGLSVLEALQSGCPVIAAHNSSVPEVAADAALWLSELSQAGIAAALREVLGSAELRAQMRARGLERARQFSWVATARRTVAVYEEVAGERRGA